MMADTSLRYTSRRCVSIMNPHFLSSGSAAPHWLQNYQKSCLSCFVRSWHPPTCDCALHHAPLMHPNKISSSVSPTCLTRLWSLGRGRGGTDVGFKTTSWGDVYHCWIEPFAFVHTLRYDLKNPTEKFGDTQWKVFGTMEKVIPKWQDSVV